MKLNSKGFMLVEVVVVSAVIATVLVTMFISVNRVTSAYRDRDSYNSIDALYLAMTVNDILINDNDLSRLVCENSAAKDITDSNLKDAYSNVGDINVYYCPYNKDKVNSLKTFNNKNTFSGFVDYISNKFNYSDSSFNYLIVSEICKDNDCYYYALKLKYDTNKCG